MLRSPRALEVAVGRGEGVLDGVLGLLARTEHVPAEAEDAGAVALEDDLEGELVTAPDLLDEPLVAREGEQALRAKHPNRSAACDGSGRHGLWVVPACIAHRNAIGTRRFARNPQTFGFDRRFSPHEEDHASGRARTDPRSTGGFSREAAPDKADKRAAKAECKTLRGHTDARARRSARSSAASRRACARAPRRGAGGAERSHERRQGVQGGATADGVARTAQRNKERFGKCVSEKAKAKEHAADERGPAGRDRVQERRQGVRRPSVTTPTRRARRSPRSTARREQKNAFGKCVSQKARRARRRGTEAVRRFGSPARRNGTAPRSSWGNASARLPSRPSIASAAHSEFRTDSCTTSPAASNRSRIAAESSRRKVNSSRVALHPVRHPVRGRERDHVLAARVRAEAARAARGRTSPRSASRRSWRSESGASVPRTIMIEPPCAGGSGASGSVDLVADQQVQVARARRSSRRPGSRACAPPAARDEVPTPDLKPKQSCPCRRPRRPRRSPRRSPPRSPRARAPAARRARARRTATRRSTRRRSR